MLSLTSEFNESFIMDHVVNNSEFLQVIHWKKKAPRRLVSSAEAGKVTDFSERLSLHLNTKLQSQISENQSSRFRKNEVRQTELCGALRQSLQWSMFAFEESAKSVGSTEPSSPVFVATLNLLESLSKKSPREVDFSQRLNALNESVEIASELEAVSPLDLLAILHLLTWLPNQVDQGTLFSLWKCGLIQTITLSEQFETAFSNPTADQSLLVMGELFFHAGSVYSEVVGMKNIRHAGRQFLVAELSEQCDTDGTPSAEILSRLPFWIASIVRANHLAEWSSQKLFSKEELQLFNAILERTVGMCDSGGRLAMTQENCTDTVSLLQAAAKQMGWSKHNPASIYLRTLCSQLPQTPSSKGLSASNAKRAGKFQKGSPPSSQSDWSHLACLRNNWLPHSDCAVVAYQNEFPQIKLSAFGTPILQGDWEIQVWKNEQIVVPEPEAVWTCVCWCSDKDGDYIELVMEITETVSITRRLFLSRNDHFLLLDEAVQGEEGASLRWQSRLPLVDDAKSAFDRTTREIHLQVNAVKPRLFPLALPQDRVDRASGTIELDDQNRIAFSYAPHGSAFCSPLFLDWSPTRRKKLADWQTLTVTDDGRRLHSDEAAGYRLRMGKHQWLYYQRLCSSEEPHSVLGMHTFNEAVLSEFSLQGEMTPLFQVETEEVE